MTSSYAICYIRYVFHESSVSCDNLHPLIKSTDKIFPMSGQRQCLFRGQRTALYLVDKSARFLLDPAQMKAESHGASL